MVNLITQHISEIITGVGASLLTYTTLKNKILTNSLEITKYKAESELIEMLQDQIDKLNTSNTQLTVGTNDSYRNITTCENEVARLNVMCSEFESRIQLQDAVINHLSTVLKDTRDSIQRL